MKETALAGTAEEIQAWIRKMGAMGVKQVVIPGIAPEYIHTFATHVVQEMQ